ncbi:POLD2 protein [Gonium pectorale]|uniref:POLD2 protein n=1 Tax=Gonium pectorale TaxID=33097 RepID=A0A150FZ26_GONPE|nr:POLD2 protein [Gonium pectorale]|eukprot:KXZ42854.1 POLD2 protein [Gonium pectorale]
MRLMVALVDERFRAAKRTYERQYAQLYFSRLMLLKSVMRARVEQLWPGVPVCSILEVQESREVAVIGTVYKNMKLKPSILDEYTKDRGLKAALGATNFCADDDSVVLEDEGARMVLAAPGQGGAAATADCAGRFEGPLDVQTLVTGMVLAVRGVHEPGGDFVVSAVCLPGLAPHPHPLAGPALRQGPAAAADALPDDKYTQLALDFLTGHLGSPVEQRLSAQIVRLVIAGGCIGQLEALAGAGPGGGGGVGANPYSRQAAGAAALQPVRDLDMVLSELAAGLPVDVMPGPEDPANVALPQQPMHRCLFPASGGYGSFVRATNPHEFESEGVRLLGSSGQNLDDMAKYCNVRDRLDLMERSLACRHLAPTAPDTLTCYPFHDTDPFILESSPHVYFVGNQPAFATRLTEAPQAGAGGAGGVAVRLVCVPSFARSGTIVLVNLRTLACHPVRFGGGLGGGMDADA